MDREEKQIMDRTRRRHGLGVYRSLIVNRIWTVVIVSVVPMILAGGIVLYQFNTSYREKVRAHLGTLVRKHKQNIDVFLKERLDDIRFLAGRCSLEELSDPGSLEEILDTLQAGFSPAFVDLGVIDEKGVQVAYAGPYRLARADYSNADWYKKAMQQNHVITDVFLGLRGLPHFIVTVRRESGGRPWVLRATIDFAAFNNLVENIRIGETGFAFILNREGKLQTKSLVEIKPDTEPYADLLRSKALEDIQIAEEKDEQGHKNIYVAAFLKDGDWLLIYRQRSSDAFSDIRRALEVTAVIILLGTLGSIGLAVFRLKSMAGRLDEVEHEKEMMNAQIIEAGKLASVGELASGIAHEINNPVAIMVEEAGWIEDLLEEEDLRACKNVDEFRRALEQIRRQGRRCKEITHKLLSFARKTDSQVQDVYLGEIIKEIVDLSAQRAKFSNVTIRTEGQDGLPPIQASATEIQQVFMNLINNALDAMGEKGGSIDIRCRTEDGTVFIDVADTGQGIPRANLARIFDPFFTTKRVGKGTGLGLSIVYGIIRKMNGRIEVSSLLGEGTTFHLELPVDGAAA